jgi:hypothetical protein
VDAPVQYGHRLTAVVIYLLVAQFGAQKRVAQAVTDLFGVPISQGSVAAMTARAARRLDGDFLAALRTALAAAEWFISMRPGSVSQAGCTGSTRPRPASTAWCMCIRNGAVRP